MIPHCNWAMKQIFISVDKSMEVRECIYDAARAKCVVLNCTGSRLCVHVHSRPKFDVFIHPLIDF